MHDSIYIKVKKMKTNLASISLDCCDKLPQNSVVALNNRNLFCHSSEVQKTKIKVSVELNLSTGSEKESTLCPSPSVCWLPAILGNLWFVDVSPQILPPLHQLSIIFSLSLIRTLVIGLKVHPNLQWTHL